MDTFFIKFLLSIKFVWFDAG